jgi:hypothetical protein
MKALVLSAVVSEPAGLPEIRAALSAIEYAARTTEPEQVVLFDMPDDTKMYEIKVVPREEERFRFPIRSEEEK